MVVDAVDPVCHENYSGGLVDNKMIPPKCVQRVQPLIFLAKSPSTEFLMRSCCVPFFDGGYSGGVRALRFEPHPDKAAEPSRTFVGDPFTRPGRVEPLDETVNVAVRFVNTPR